jgi:hypothetical protein
VTEWSYNSDRWWDVWRRGEWMITRHPRRHNGYHVVTYQGHEVTMKDSLELAKRFVERQMTA